MAAFAFKDAIRNNEIITGKKESLFECIRKDLMDEDDKLTLFFDNGKGGKNPRKFP
jgi:hypothetical protein